MATQENGKFKPDLVKERDMKQGLLFTVQTYEDIPWVLAAGGSSGQLAIWDTEEDAAIVNRFKG